MIDLIKSTNSFGYNTYILKDNNKSLIIDYNNVEDLFLTCKSNFHPTMEFKFTNFNVEFSLTNFKSRMSLSEFILILDLLYLNIMGFFIKV